MLNGESIRDLLLSQDELPFERVAAMQHEAQWGDVAAKAKRLVQDGHVTILRNAPHHVMSHVQGDHGEYNCEISRHDPTSQIIEQWNCECPWAQFAFDRTRKWKKLEGRVCSHVLATYWKAKSTPIDMQGFEDQQPGRGQAQQPKQQTIPGMPFSNPMTDKPHQQKPGMPEPEEGQAPAGPEAPPANLPGTSPNVTLPHTDDLTMPKQPESPFAVPKAPAPPQHEQLKLFDINAPPGMQPNPQAPAVSIPGGRPPTPGNPIGFPGTFSHFIPMMIVRSSKFIYAKDAMSEYFETQRAAMKPLYVTLKTMVTLEQTGGKLPMPEAVPYGTSSEGVSLYNVMDLGFNPETGLRENADVNALQGAPAQTGKWTDVPPGRKAEVLDFDDSLKMAYIVVPLNYPEGGDVRLHPHALKGWVDYKDIKPAGAGASPWRS